MNEEARPINVKEEVQEIIGELKRLENEDPVFSKIIAELSTFSEKFPTKAVRVTKYQVSPVRGPCSGIWFRFCAQCVFCWDVLVHPTEAFVSGDTVVETDTEAGTITFSTF